MSTPLRIIFGGTFDPVHNGHVAVANMAAERFNADVDFLPASDPPHRTGQGADAATRAHLVELAVAPHPRLHVDRRELARSGPSWSVLSLRELRREHGPRQPLAWLIGDDAFAGLPTWRDWQCLPDLCHWIVAVRPDADGRTWPGEAAIQARWPQPLRDAVGGCWIDDPAQLTEAPAGRLARLTLPPRPESSTGVRERIASGGAWQDWVPASVAESIAQRGLYGISAGQGPAAI